MLAEFQSILRCPQVSSLMKTGLRQQVIELAGKASGRTKEKNEIQPEVRLFAKWRNPGTYDLLRGSFVLFCFFLFYLLI